MVHRTLTTVAMFVLALAASLSAFGSNAEPNRYTFDRRSIYLDGKPIFTLPKDEIDGTFKGPIPLGSRIVFIETTRNLALAFAADSLLQKVTISPSTSREDFPSHIFTAAIIRMDRGLLVFNMHGEARFVTIDLGVSRLRALDVDPFVDGEPHLYSFSSVAAGKIRVPCSVRAIGDRYIVIDLDQMKIVERGATAKGAAATPKSPP